jgi:signal transduction histidine kinase
VTLYSGVALNLFTNGLKAVTGSTDSDPRIAVRAWNERGAHVLEVSDTGVGIPPTLRERVFDPLFTTTASRNDPLGSGMGLGLSLVRRTVEAFGGKVNVVDPPAGFNTTVRVTFPVSEEK